MPSKNPLETTLFSPVILAKHKSVRTITSNQAFATCRVKIGSEPPKTICILAPVYCEKRKKDRFGMEL
ncbi:MAG: hypothetical protein PHU28_00565 [Methanosarcinaceae archaeon]|nr:hypothetical protein [Methanosarcinaceae archaeon]